MRGRAFPAAIVALIWLAILAEPAAAACKLGKIAEIPVTMHGLRPMVPAKVNGKDANFFIDTGGFWSLVPAGSVAKFGMRASGAPGGTMMVMGETGSTGIEVAHANDFNMFGYSIHGADFIIVPGIENSVDGVIGRNLLMQYDLELDLASGVARMFQEDGCGGASLAYWNHDGSYSEITIDPMARAIDPIIGWITVNGVKLRATFDTGAPTSIITLTGAARAGVKTTDAGVRDGGPVGGVSGRTVQTWIAPFKSFQIDNEFITNMPLRIGKVELGDSEVLLGNDFFLSHRVYISISQRKMFLTYNGGPVFNLVYGGRSAAAQTTSTATSGNDEDAPTDADGFARRAAARIVLHNYDGAIADYTQAIALDPKSAQRYSDRGIAHAADKQSDAALADFDQALQLDPANIKALIARAALRLDNKDLAGGKADFDAALARNSKLRLEIATIYERRDIFEPAVEQYSQWIVDQDHKPGVDQGEIATALNDRCWVRALWNHDLDAALDDCNRAVDLSHRAPGILDSRGFVHLRLGQFDAALDDYDAALKSNPRMAWTLYCRGLAKLKKGMADEGHADMAAASAIDLSVPDRAAKYGLTP